jgi:O-glycosyl hydrolase
MCQATDVNLTHFSVERDEAYVLPAIRAGAPAAEDSLRLFASPWSAPAWMKSSNALGGGTLLKQHRGTYARYLLRFLEAYQQRGVNVSAMTVQNEPLQNDSAYPSMRMLPQVEGEVIEAMTKAFLAQAQGSSSATALKRLPDVWCFDHNWSDEWYPEVLLDSPRFADLIGGSAFHHYSGQPSAMSTLHSHHPDKPIYMSEGSEFGVAGASKIVTYFRNWASSYTAWVTMLDQKRKPNSGPFSADATMMELDTRTMKVCTRVNQPAHEIHD